MNAIIKTNGLTKTFINGKVSQQALKNLDIQIYQSDFTVIMGPSGSGKSTLLYALSGMDKVTNGDIIYLENFNIAKLSTDQLADFRANNCGFVFQQIHLVDNMSILDNVLLSGLLKNKNKAQVVKNAKKLLLSVGLPEMIFNKFPYELSGGEAQRVALVRAAINNPSILFADEPTGALNSLNSKLVLDVLSNLNKTGQSVVMVTHDILSALRANRILYLKDGKIEGELKLKSYYEDDQEQRKNTLRQFLSQLGW